MRARAGVRQLAYAASSREQWIAAAGGFVGILAVLGVSHALLAGHDAWFIVASMGASAVLLFATPHGALAQPWPLLGGHLVSAAIGVTLAKLIPESTLAAALAVALAIGAMYALRCLHPPGGATALFAVLGGEAVAALGYGYLIVPVLINALTLLVVAVLFNYPFVWRRYPRAWQRETACTFDPATHPEKCHIPHSALVYALSQIDSFIDISEDDLQRIYATALAAANTPSGLSPSPHPQPASNGAGNPAWRP